MAPTDEELLELMPQGFRDDLALVSRMAAHGAGPEVQPGLFRVTLNTGALDYARAVWDRFGHQPAPPAAGEVAELVAALRIESSRCTCTLLTTDDLRRAADLLERLATPAPPAAGEVGEVGELVAWLRSTGEGQPCLSDEGYARLTRAADLLEQRQPAPVPVAERLPGPEDCDEEGRCWLLTVEDEYPQWRLHSIEGSQPGGATMIWVPVDSSPGVMVDAFYASHWLPAHALPLPSGEVQP